MSKDQDKKAVLLDFAQKAAQRIQDKRIPKRASYYVASVDQEILLRGLTAAELQTCVSMEDGSGNDADNYAVYTGVVEPSLKEAAQSIMEAESGLPADQKTILQPVDIVNCFTLQERGELALAVLELSGVTGGKKIEKVTDDLKN